jgi:hypothetical protein
MCYPQKKTYALLIAFLMVVSVLHAQHPEPTFSMSGIIVSEDSLAIPDVVVVNSRTGKAVHTNASGYFKADMAKGDSLFVYHIAYERRYITAKDNGKLIVLKPEIQQIRQVNINDLSRQEQKNLDETVQDIMRLAPMKTLAGYDLHSREDYFILENGSLTRGFSPFFGPTLHVPLEKISGLLIRPKTPNDSQNQPSATTPAKNDKKKPAKNDAKQPN